MTKITFLMLHIGVGGIERATINTCNTLCHDFDIEIISFYKLKNDSKDQLDKKIKIKYLYDGEPNRDAFKLALKKMKAVKILKEGIKAADILRRKKTAIIREIKKINDGIIVSTRMEFNVLLSQYGNKNVLKIAQEHQYHNDNKKYIKTIKTRYKNLDYLLALTETLRQDYIEFLRGTKVKVVLMPNMLPSISDDCTSLDANTIISVGRFHWAKRIPMLIDVLNHLQKNVRLVLIGDGEDRVNVEAKIKEVGLENRVMLTGTLGKPKIDEWYLKSGLFVMTSQTEGLPMVLLEAMDKGVPCVAFETKSGVGDIIKDGVNGYIIKNDNIKRMADKINELLNDQNKLCEFSNNAKETVKDFSNEKIKEKWINLLNQGLKAKL